MGFLSTEEDVSPDSVLGSLGLLGAKQDEYRIPKPPHLIHSRDFTDPCPGKRGGANVPIRMRDRAYSRSQSAGTVGGSHPTWDTCSCRALNLDPLNVTSPPTR